MSSTRTTVITFGRFGTPRAYDVPRGHVTAPRMTVSLEHDRQQWVDSVVERLLSVVQCARGRQVQWSVGPVGAAWAPHVLEQSTASQAPHPPASIAQGRSASRTRIAATLTCRRFAGLLGRAPRCRRADRRGTPRVPQRVAQGCQGGNRGRPGSGSPLRYRNVGPEILLNPRLLSSRDAPLVARLAGVERGPIGPPVERDD
jgi:hypothetical protein